MISSPLNLELLLFCYYSNDPHPRLGAPAVDDGLRYLLKEGMIRLNRAEQPNVYDATARGEAFIDHLMNVPFPEQHWIVPDGPPRQT